MIRVAICDDLPEEIGKLKSHIERYALDNQLQISVSGFSNAEEITAALDEAASFDVIFLDIYMESLNGLALARHITVSGEKSNIIFVSTSTEHALDAFGVNALQYLTKPVSYDKFVNAIKIALEHKAKCEETLTILSGNDVVKIPFDNIIYAEAQRNYQKIYLSTGEVETTRTSNTKLYELMQVRCEFVRLGASFIHNLKFVSRISAKDIILSNGKIIPVPRGSFTQLKEKYLSYYNMGGNISSYTLSVTDELYKLPSSIEVKANSSILTSSQYSYNSSTGEITIPAQYVTGDIYITAEAVSPYIVTYYANGGTGNMSTDKIKNGSSFTLKANGFTRNGFVFKGWATSAGGSVVYGDKATVTPTQNLALYAVWEYGGHTDADRNGKCDYCDETLVTEIVLDATSVTVKDYIGGVLILASYSGDESNEHFIDCKIITEGVVSSTTISISDTGLNTSGASKIKAFLWNDKTLIKPLCEAKSATIE